MRLLTALLAGFVIAQVANLFTTVYLHRAIAHKAVTLNPVIRFVARAVIWLSTGIKPRQWAAVHRKHHAMCDTPEDPHSPQQVGWVRVQLTNAAMYRRVAVNPETVPKYAKDIKVDTLDKVLFDRAWLGLGLGIVGLVLVLGPIYGLVAAVTHMICYLGLSGAVNGPGHWFGKRPYDNTGTNMLWLALLTSGEGWHNNHHAVPTAARIGFDSKAQIDFGWYFIWVCTKLGLAKVRIENVVVRDKPRTPMPVG